jgi:NAD/NADP transhydrogenase alpha subunit
MNQVFVKKAAERAVRTFLQGYLSIWIVGGASFDGLVSMDNIKTGVVAAALSIAMSMGLKGVGPDKESPSAV